MIAAGSLLEPCGGCNVPRAENLLVSLKDSLRHSKEAKPVNSDLDTASGSQALLNAFKDPRKTREPMALVQEMLGLTVFL